ncbi:transposase domain-containing protein [Paraburkholderia sediminicola]|uniref:transposase domain-containing protein n=1 Tax=Paraburkholderia sediminicola TaxID=458836 RepID=UPI0038BB4BF3
MNLHALPWPREELEKLQNANVQMRVTLSFFVESYAYLVALFQALPLAHGVDDYEALLPWGSWPHRTDARPPTLRKPRDLLRAYRESRQNLIDKFRFAVRQACT